MWWFVAPLRTKPLSAYRWLLYITLTRGSAGINMHFYFNLSWFLKNCSFDCWISYISSFLYIFFLQYFFIFLPILIKPRIIDRMNYRMLRNAPQIMRNIKIKPTYTTAVACHSKARLLSQKNKKAYPAWFITSKRD